MDLRDYVRLIRRGWPLLALVILLSLSVAALYLVLAPKQYSAEATVVVSINDPSNVGDAVQGLAAATTAAATYAGVIDSAVVIGPVAGTLKPAVSLQDALGMVSAVPREGTAIVDIVAVGSDPRSVTELSNGVAEKSMAIIPALQGRSIRNSPITLQVIQNASQPVAPISPDPKQVLALGLILGIALGLALTIAFQTLNTRLRRPEDMQRIGLLVLAALPRVPRAQRQGVVVADHPNSPAVEAYRTLRTNLGNLDSEARRSLLIAPVRDDRDPDVPVNIAWSLAQAGKSVLLVDLDLRRAPISELLQLPVGPGLTDLLGPSRSEPVGVTRPTLDPRVFVLTAGTPHSSPSDLLSLPKLGELIRGWEREYDYVVMNAPSLLKYTDAAVVARETGVTLVTVQAGRTKAEDLSTAIGTLHSVRVEPMGAVLTGTRASTVRDNRRIRGGGTTRPRTRMLERTTTEAESDARVDYVHEDSPTQPTKIMGSTRH